MMAEKNSRGDGTIKREAASVDVDSSVCTSNNRPGGSRTGLSMDPEGKKAYNELNWLSGKCL